MMPAGGERRSAGAFAVGAGIFCSRIAGLLRTSALGAFFGVGPHADVLAAALRLPNLLQNLLGEQTLSASFIPVYARLLGEGRREEAGRFAGAIFSLLVAVAGGAALVGVLLAKPIVSLFAAGFLRDRALVAAGAAAVDRFPLAVAAVQWIFPMAALLVLSAWALGILNSHGRFFLPYVAPVAWNAAIVAAVAWAALGAQGGVRAADPERLLRAACIGALVGGALQLLVQLPAVIREMEGWSGRPRWGTPAVREAIRAFLPTLAGRGVVQLSSYFDQLLASLLAAGAVGALSYAQTLYLLPVSLFGLSFAAAALPEMARRRGAGETGELASHLNRSRATASFLNLPVAVAYLLLGLPLVQGVFRLFGGRFGAAESALVYLVLGAYALGLPAATEARLLQAGLYAHGDARSPARFAFLRVALATAVGIPAMLWLDGVAIGDVVARLPAALGAVAPASDLRLGAVGLALAASAAAWLELSVLRRSVRRQLAIVEDRAAPRFVLYALAAAVAPLGLLVAGVLAAWPAPARAALLLGLFATAYLLLARREEPARALIARFGIGR